MTTIACDGKTIAADGLLADPTGLAVSFQRKKLTRLRDGSIVGAAGDAECQELLTKWLEEGGKPPKLGRFEAIRFMPDRSIVRYGNSLQPVPIDAPAAIGSGTDLALGAMLAGELPREAVEIAAQRDTATGGVIIEMAHP